MGNLVVVGLKELRPHFGAYEQFVGPLWNVFSVSNVRRPLWNGTLMYDKLYLFFPRF